MPESAQRKNPVSAHDLGFGKLALTGAALSIGVLPSALGLYFDLDLLSALGIGGASMTATGIAIVLALRHLRRGLVAPLDEVLQAMEQLRASGKAPHISEIAAPVLQPVLRRINQVSVAIEQRGRRSLANLMSVEAAFDRVHAVLQSLREGVVVVDPEGRIVLANRNARRLLQFGDGRIEAELLLDKLDGDLRQAIADGLQRVDREKVTELHAADIRFGDHIFDLTIVQVQSNRPDQDFGKVVVVGDVTRNHELNRLKDGLLSSISHELRTPLTNMCSSSEILTTLTPADETEWREFAGMLNTESRRLKAIVDDVLEYNLLETRRTTINLQRADVAAAARAAFDAMRPLADKKGIHFECTAPVPAMSLVDPERLNEALCRVLDNAIKFTPPDGRVSIEVLTTDGMVEVAIADSGPGVPAALRDRVFDRLSQFGDVMTDKPQGAGLGLAITQRLVDAMGGTIWCEDSPLGGAQFRFVVPLAETNQVAPPA